MRGSAHGDADALLGQVLLRRIEGCIEGVLLRVDDHELAAAEAVGLSLKELLDEVGGAANELIAGPMSQLVVDGLRSVQVEAGDAQPDASRR